MLESLDWNNDPSLPVITSCDDCCSCCLEQPAPPGYMLALLGLGDADDRDRLEQMPALLREELARFSQRRQQGDPDALQQSGPCFWLDVESRRCRHHEWRPQICRDHECGSESCRFWRDRYPPT